MSNLCELLQKLGIEYREFEHPAVFTVDEAQKVRIDVDFGENKNLFLRNRKGTKHYLVTIAAKKQLDLKRLGELLGKSNLGFASEERLHKYLGLTKGSVSPFGLLNDTDHEVIYVMDNDLLMSDTLGFHPNINTKTIVLKTEGFKKYLEATGNEIIYTDL